MVYIGHRLGRLPGTPYRIAAGFACGAAISFTPLIGLHFVGAALLSLLMRANVVASAIGTAVGNPWTFPFIWAWIYALGNWILGRDSSALPYNLSLTFIFDHFWDILWPMLIGGIPTAIVAWFIFFYPAQYMVAEYQGARRRRIRRKVMRRRAEAIAAEARGTPPPGKSRGVLAKFRRAGKHSSEDKDQT
ncbi:MAG: DUF2062 domain-containing protein [Pseudomonadota bacterium]